VASVELIEWSLGGARLVSVPGEAFHAFGRAMETSRPGPVLLAGLAPVWLGYLPMPYAEGYEESMSYGEPFVSALLGALTEAVTDSAVDAQADRPVRRRSRVDPAGSTVIART
jgi:hypothetical protein